jgi:hypothetical protein
VDFISSGRKRTRGVAVLGDFEPDRRFAGVLEEDPVEDRAVPEDAVDSDDRENKPIPSDYNRTMLVSSVAVRGAGCRDEM